LETLETLKESKEHGAATPEDERTIVDLMMDQVEFADTLILNKTDLVAKDELDTIRSLLKKLNPTAELILSTFSKVPLDQILNTGRFSMEHAMTRPGWLQELRGTHTPETEEYGVGSFVYRNHERPFHPERLQASLPRLFGQEAPAITEGGAAQAQGDDTFLGNVLRSKGSIWLASMHDVIVSWASAGQQVSLQPQQPWLVSMTPEQLADLPEEDKLEVDEQLRQTAERAFGDRESELVFIGIGLEQAAIVGILDAALLTDEEMKLGPAGWADLPCPFVESWTGEEGDADEEADEDEGEKEGSTGEE